MQISLEAPGPPGTGTSTDTDTSAIAGTGTDGDRCEVRIIDSAKVEETRRSLPGDSGIETSAAMFKLMGDPKRLKILLALKSAGELCVCDLAATVMVSETGVSQALRLLRSAGIVRHRRQGRQIHYSLDDRHIADVLDTALEHASHPTTGEARHG